MEDGYVTRISPTLFTDKVQLAHRIIVGVSGVILHHLGSG